jgi:hypothetical protein
MVKVRNMVLLMLFPMVVTAVCMVWVAYFPNPMA